MKRSIIDKVVPFILIAVMSFVAISETVEADHNAYMGQVAQQVSGVIR